MVVAKFSHSINCYTTINLTKLDILDGLEEVKVAIAYEVDGVELESFPGGWATGIQFKQHLLIDDKTADLTILERAKPVYKTFPGWVGEQTTSAVSFHDLPKAARDYIEFIEAFLGVPIEYIGVGPARENMVMRGKALGN